MGALLILLAWMTVVLGFLPRKGEESLSAMAFGSFIMSDVGVTPGSTTYRQIMEAQSASSAERAFSALGAGRKEPISVSLRGRGQEA